MRRRDSAFAMLMLAMLASLGVHLPVWGALGALAKAIDWSPDERADEPTFVDFDPIDVEAEVEEPEEEQDEPNPETEVEDVDESDPQQDADPQNAVEQRVEEEEEEEPPPMQLEEMPRNQDNATPVQQQSADPTVAPPPDARFIARENSRVEQETIASVRNLVQDAQENLSPGAQLEESESEDVGNADESEVRETRDEDGPEDQMPVPVEQEEQETRAAPEYQGERPREIQEREAREGGQEDEMETVTINDGNGTFVIRRPRNRGTGGGEQGGAAQRRRRGRAGSILDGNAQNDGPNLRIGWQQFEGIYGEEQLRQERDEYAQEVLTRQRGNGERSRRWREFIAGIENFVPGVQPGNQTALNARASPFAEWLAALHRRIHVSFHRFLDGLGGSASNPLNDPELKVRLEFVFADDGSIARFGVVNSSGVLPYDFGAYNAVRRAGPFPAPPDAIKSGDGLVYIHWTFERVPPFCHGQNARPFILDNANAAPRTNAGEGTLEMGGIVPQGTMPNWDGNGSPPPGESSE